MKVKVKIEGLREVKDALRKLPNSTAKSVLRRVGKKRLKPVADRARSYAPEDQGELKDSIGVSTRLSKSQKRKHRKPDRNDVEVYAGAGPHPQAHLQEFGTKDAPPQPFMRPAWSAEKRGVLQGIKIDLWSEIKKAADRLARKTARLATKR
jgi:HK97 gp10 family phage protein